ncbi:MAG: hypothetical protein ACYCYO_21500 [Bacilli bacterium]
MKKWIVSVCASAMILGAMTAPAFANVVQNGGPGKPTGAYSNPGSSQGQAHRSSTGGYNKETHDGYIEIW